jgi:hypothetical protein
MSDEEIEKKFKQFAEMYHGPTPGPPEPNILEENKKLKEALSKYPEYMTKREYLAAMAMQGILSNSTIAREGLNEKEIAEWARNQADELLNQLSK